MRRHSNWHKTHPNAESFSDFIAERQVMNVADLNVTLMRGISHESLHEGSKEKYYRRAVTRRGSSISSLSLSCANRLGHSLAKPVLNN